MQQDQNLQEHEQLLTVKQSAKFLGISISSLYLFMQRGELPYAKFGSARRIPKAALLAFIRSHMIANR